MSIARQLIYSNVNQYPRGWYWADQSFAAKTVSGAADRYKIVSPNAIQADIDGDANRLTAASLTQVSSVTPDCSAATNWDTTSGTDYTVAANRAGKDFYIYSCIPTTGSVPKLLLSANASCPSGYTAYNSRKVGGFHCLCVAVGTISGHTLTDYLAGDILPASVWDLKFRCETLTNEGLTWDAKRKKWVQIYLASSTGASTASVYNATISDTRPWLDFVDDGAAIGMALPFDGDFQSLAAGSNEQTNINGNADPGTTGGHSDASGRRMISNIGCEDCCGVEWQWLQDQSFRPGSGAAGWKNVLGGTKGQIYLLADDADVKLIAGGCWNDGAVCGSRSRHAYNARWLAFSHLGARFVARAIYR